MAHKFIDGNLEMFRATSTTIPMTFNIDITGATIYISAKKELTDTAFIMQVSQAVHDDPANGITHIDISSTDTDFNADSYYMDIQIEFSETLKEVIYPKIEDKIAYLIILDHPKE